MDPDVEVVAVQLPGREERIGEPHATELVALARAIASEMLPLLDRPYGLYGHSLGSLVAFETARELERLGAPVPRILVEAAHRAPQVPRKSGSWHDLPESELIERLRRLGGTPEAVLQHPELMELLLPIFRADLALVDRYGYEPGPLLRCPILAVGAIEDTHVSQDALAAWADQTRAGFEMIVVPGHHVFMQQPEALAELWPHVVGALGE